MKYRLMLIQHLHGFRLALGSEGKGKGHQIIIKIMQHEGIAVGYAEFACLLEQLRKAEAGTGHQIFIPGKRRQAIERRNDYRIGIL